MQETLEHSLADVLNHGKFINGPEVQKFGELLSDFTKNKHSITCANGTDALAITLSSRGKRY